MGMLSKQKKAVALKSQRGEMPIGPILIIALIVIPLVFILITQGQAIADKFVEESDDILGETIE